MKNKRIIFVTLALLFCLGSAFAQAKKPAAKKKSPPKALSIYLCDSEKDKLFHKRRACAGLNKCSGEIKLITSTAVLKKYKRKSCPRCNK